MLAEITKEMVAMAPCTEVPESEEGAETLEELFKQMKTKLDQLQPLVVRLDQCIRNMKTPATPRGPVPLCSPITSQENYDGLREPLPRAEPDEVELQHEQVYGYE